MKTLFIFLLLLNFVKAQALTITSLNIEWFGRGGEVSGNIYDEYRGERIKEFISQFLSDTDVFVFQEITHKNSLFKIMDDFECISYDADTLSHQFVVMCSKPGLLKSHSVNHDIRLSRVGLRAAIVGDYLKNGVMTRIAGVHLKAGRFDTKTRVEQIRKLMTSLETNDPVVVLGDFNTYTKERTGLDFNDEFYVSQIMGNDYKLVENEIPTYMGFGGRVFDRAWVKNKIYKEVEVIGPCDASFRGLPFEKRSFYNRFVSDHCALKLRFQ